MPALNLRGRVGKSWWDQCLPGEFQNSQSDIAGQNKNKLTTTTTKKSHRSSQNRPSFDSYVSVRDAVQAMVCGWGVGQPMHTAANRARLVNWWEETIFSKLETANTFLRTISLVPHSCLLPTLTLEITNLKSICLAPVHTVNKQLDRNFYNRLPSSKTCAVREK